MVLSDITIKERIRDREIILDPYDSSRVQPSSVDVCLDGKFKVFESHTKQFIDVKEDNSDLLKAVEVEDDQAFILHPNEFVLGQTVEVVGVPDDLVARIEGKSSLGRYGILIHATAGYIDPGFEGRITLELANLSRLPVTLYKGMPIGQLSFILMDQRVETPYSKERGSKYHGQMEPTGSAYNLNFKRNKSQTSHPAA